MNKNAKKITGALTSLTLVAGAGAVVASTATQAEAATDTQAAIAVETGSQSESNLVNVPTVSGTFSYSQTALTPNKTITEVFCKAAATLCASLPDYGCSYVQASINVSGDVDNAFSATVSEMTDQEGAAKHVMACACASNVPGGGAIANAEVEGVSLESVAAMAQAK